MAIGLDGLYSGSLAEEGESVEEALGGQAEIGEKGVEGEKGQEGFGGGEEGGLQEPGEPWIGEEASRGELGEEEEGGGGGQRQGQGILEEEEPIFSVVLLEATGEEKVGFPEMDDDNEGDNRPHEDAPQSVEIPQGKGDGEENHRLGDGGPDVGEQAEGAVELVCDALDCGEKEIDLIP